MGLEERAEGERRAGRGRETAANNRADGESQRRDTSEGRQQNRRVELIVSGEVIGTTIGTIVLQPVASATSPQ